MTSENEGKKNLDSLASALASLDSAVFKRRTAQVHTLLKDSDVLTPRVCVTGGAGSGKTRFAQSVSKLFHIPVFDFDEYIVGGYHPSGDVYRARLAVARSKLWSALPQDGGWVIEHVEACNPEMLDMAKPLHCVIIEPVLDDIMRVAKARAEAASDTAAGLAAREKRALESREYARMQFNKVPGRIILDKKDLQVKRLG